MQNARSHILQTFLNRDRIYHHPKMQTHGPQAQINLTQELKALA